MKAIRKFEKLGTWEKAATKFVPEVGVTVKVNNGF
jgi:hypothetical protein